MGPSSEGRGAACSRHSSTAQSRAHGTPRPCPHLLDAIPGPLLGHSLPKAAAGLFLETSRLEKEEKGWESGSSFESFHSIIKLNKRL